MKHKTASTRNKYFALSLVTTWLLITLLIAGLGSQTSQASGGWGAPLRLQSYVSQGASLAVNPFNGSVGYLAASSAYGVITTNEDRNWLNQDYLKFSTDGGASQPDATYDEFGILYGVWMSGRAFNGYFNIFFDRALPQDSTVGQARNLTEEIGGTHELTWENPHIAYSIKQKKLYLIYTTRGSDNNSQPLWFTVSGDYGTTWSAPTQIATLTGYRPAEPELIIDGQGLPHVFWGQDDNAPATIEHKYQDLNGQWSTTEIAASGDRPIFTQARLAPNGDIYLVWYDGGPGVSRWDHTTGQWLDLTTHLGVLIHAATAQLPTLAVDKNGTVWLMWINAPYGGSDNEFIAAAVSQDQGKTWSLPEAVLHTTDALIGRITSMTATSSKGLVYLSYVADSKDPNHTSGSTLWLQTVISSNLPDYPTPTPGGTQTPGTPTPTPTATTGAIVGQPTYTPAATYTPQATYTPAATYTPQATYTPAATYTTAPTYTPVPTATAPALAVNPVPTATPIIMVTATATATANPDQGFEIAPTVAPTRAVPTIKSTGNGNSNPVQSGSSQVEQTTSTPTNTPIPTPSITITGIVPAAAVVQHQGDLTAAAPQLVSLPTVLANRPRESGIGPRLELPTATATAKPTVTPTVTATPTATATAQVTTNSTSMATVSSTVTTSSTTNITNSVSVIPTTTTDGTGVGQPTNSNPPGSGAIWLFPLGIIAVGRGALTFLNLLALKQL